MLHHPTVLIRPYQIEDAAALFEAGKESFAEMNPFMPWCHANYALDEARSWVKGQVLHFESGTEFQFAILSNENKYIGGCGLNAIDRSNRRANLGYWVRTSATGQGVATAATRQLVDWAFENTDLNRLEVVVSVKNTASLRVAEKAGAVREGLLRGRLVLHGQAHDAAVFSFVR
jgi:ribosomal-protein-serine acetyltransferase